MSQLVTCDTCDNQTDCALACKTIDGKPQPCDTPITCDLWTGES